jgi:hypothetical protein
LLELDALLQQQWGIQLILSFPLEVGIGQPSGNVQSLLVCGPSGNPLGNILP